MPKHKHNKENSRRNQRRKRPKLQPGQTRLAGKVVFRAEGKPFGFIQPDCGAARIYFHDEDVPYNRQKCVGVGKNVFFSVANGTKGKLKALIL